MEDLSLRVVKSSGAELRCFAGARQEFVRAAPAPSAIDGVGRTTDRGDVENVQVQFDQGEHQAVRAGDCFVVIAFEARARQRTSIAKMLHGKVGQFPGPLEMNRSRGRTPRRELQTDRM